MIKAVLATHTARNSIPILDILRDEFRVVNRVLEIGSGNGQHATTFAAELPNLVWQTSDLDENHATIKHWLADASVGNVLPPLSLDVRTASGPSSSFDGVFSANSAHIMSLPAVAKMFALVAEVLQENGVFCLYGPFRQKGEFNSDSNAAFHASLRSRNSEMGIRHLEELDEFARSSGLLRQRLFSMPANNYLAVWQSVKGE